MIHIFDQDFDQKVAEPFHEAYMAHTRHRRTTRSSPPLDLGRRQVAPEGFQSVRRQVENAMQLHDAIDNPPLLSKYMACLRRPTYSREYRASDLEQPLVPVCPT